MVSLSNHVAISLRLSTRRGTIIATATRLPPPYQVRGRNDMRKTERPWGIRGVYGDSAGRSDAVFLTDAFLSAANGMSRPPNTSRRFDATAPHTVLES